MILYRNKGFTFVEIIVVIIVLGIVAAIAVPKFTNLSLNARIASLKGMEGAMRSGTTMIYAKASIENKTEGEDQIQIGNSSIHLHNGYPIGNWMNGIRYIINLDTEFYSNASKTCEEEWCGRGSKNSIPSGVTTAGLIGKVYPNGYSWNDECGVYYLNHADKDGSAPEIGLETKDC